MKLGNIATRVLVSIVAIPAIVGLTWLGGYFFFGLVLAIGLMAFYEYTSLAAAKDAHPLVIPGLIAVAAVITNTLPELYFTDFYVLFAATMVFFALVELWHNKGSAILNISTTLFGVIYIGLFAAAVLFIRNIFPQTEHGAYLIISILATIWICDSAAFFGGLATGKHKLFERVSPNKTWEGAVWGFVFALGAMAAAKALVLNFLSWQDVLIIGGIIGTVGQIGDLVESLLKRDADIKDSSSLIPGHGGIFDRFDSLLFSSPVILFYLIYFVK